ncbi:hypothetical protein [Actinopolyspora saharensis]|uniref:Uncharacterized protein n=1 Tax=Actinopolyspora saharensis TaxID=995062 RepID=A0A1H1G8R0_9ACTN|nr:hypothetical protein [Actinopolyspora saharensis]SDR09611.1 hypothetical protein SAMN04489718_3495 [Actinopolyspora saharensis]
MSWFGQALEGIGDVVEDSAEEGSVTSALGDLVEDLGESMQEE